MVIIALPAFNEEAALPQLLAAIHRVMLERRTDYRVVVVDDGSSDGTVRVARELSKTMPVEVVEHGHNRGLGESIRTGLLRALEEAADDDIIVTMDADNTHTPGLIERMVRGIAEGNDVIIASRYRSGARIVGVPRSRRAVSVVGNLLVALSFPTPNVRDFTSGYRAYRAAVLKRAFDAYGRDFVGQSGFTCMVDILLKLRHLGAIMSEVPLVLRYDLKPGVSKMLVLRTVRQTLALLAMRRLRGK